MTGHQALSLIWGALVVAGGFALSHPLSAWLARWGLFPRDDD